MEQNPPPNDKTAPAQPPALAGLFPFLIPPDRPGDLGRLGRYRVVALLDEGGMGYVFRAEDDILRRAIALKVMKPAMAGMPAAPERFLREGRAAAAITSDHVITIYDVGDAGGVVFLAMEFLAGQNLDDWLNAHPTPVPAQMVLQVATHVLKGLAAAHEKGLIHRDIKPANLWVEAGTNRVKILDFGVTRGGGGDQELTRTGDILGTPKYMAPEQARGREVDCRADLFSLGVVLYRMLTGKSPFMHGRPLDPIPLVASLGTGLPNSLGQLIDLLLANSADDRPQTANAALAAIAEIEQQLRAGPLVPSTLSGRGWLVAGMATAVVLALVVGFLTLWKGGSREHSPEMDTSPAPPTPNGLLAGEMNEPFEYVINGVKNQGTRRVLCADIGDGVTMEFVRIDPGTFRMGAAEDEAGSNADEKPQREVTFDRGFYFGKYEVTQTEFRAVTGKTPSNFKGDRLPVENVSWIDADDFCKRLSTRLNRGAVLPSEAQWEYACRAGTRTPFHFGSKLNGDLASCDGNYPHGTETKGEYKETTVAVGAYPANRWGLHDMHGNVCEWCQDSYGPYGEVEVKPNPIQLTRRLNDRRVVRGGAWSLRARFCRATLRNHFATAIAYGFVGFRVCLPLN